MRTKLFSWAALLLVALTMFGPGVAFARQKQVPPPVDPQDVGQAAPATKDEDRIRLEKEMAKRANEERQAQLKRDTEKLLSLATELKTYVDKTNSNILSLDVIKKAEEIEKLAHSVKDKMKAQ